MHILWFLTKWERDGLAEVTTGQLAYRYMFNTQRWRTPAQQLGSISGLEQEKMDLKEVVFAVKRLCLSWYSGGTL